MRPLNRGDNSCNKNGELSLFGCDNSIFNDDDCDKRTERREKKSSMGTGNRKKNKQ
jgi:hypothetical protein